jgi:hypothetical protein
VAIEARVARKAHTPLDGTFLGWANPRPAQQRAATIRFAFDCPDAATHLHLAFPTTVEAQVAAFAQKASLYESQGVYEAAQAAEGLSFAPQSFIRQVLFSPAGDPVNPPEAHALFSGLIVEAEARQNWITGTSFRWALVATVGGTFDVGDRSGTALEGTACRQHPVGMVRLSDASHTFPVLATRLGLVAATRWTLICRRGVGS